MEKLRSGNDIEWIGLSFVRDASDIVELKHIIAQSGKPARVIAKIEKPEAIENIDEIISVTDGVMVARGDLGVEMPMEQVPVLQKMIAKKCRDASCTRLVFRRYILQFDSSRSC